MCLSWHAFPGLSDICEIGWSLPKRSTFQVFHYKVSCNFRLYVFLNVNKTWCHSGGRLAGPKWHHLGEANSTRAPPTQICKQSWVMNLSLYKMLMEHSNAILQHQEIMGLELSWHQEKMASELNFYRWLGGSNSTVNRASESKLKQMITIGISSYIERKMASKQLSHKLKS